MPKKTKTLYSQKPKMPFKDYAPITLGGLFQSDWEKLMEILDTATHPHAVQMKYNLQCKIDVAILNEEWYDESKAQTETDLGGSPQ